MTYKVCGTSSTEALYGISGPGDGLGYYAWYLYPENTFTSFDEAEKTVRLMTLAFQEGKSARSKEIRELIR